MIYNSKNWPFKWFGFWKEYGLEYCNYPSIVDFKDEDINKSYRKDKLLKYISEGTVVVSTSQLGFPSPITGELKNGTVSFRTDGQWLWLDNIYHLIESSDLIIPEVWYSEIESKDFLLPKMIQTENLEWPNL
jgi:hypothetical protein